MTAREKIVVRNHCGVHARVATGLAEIAKADNVEIELISGGRAADCRSILEVLSLALVRGSDADQALGAVRKLLTEKDSDG